jgi:hypothetical protein
LSLWVIVFSVRRAGRYDVPWQKIEGQYVKQDQPGLHTRWFWDTTDRGGGELVIWVDDSDAVQGFQLSYEQWPSGRHYVAQWSAGSRLQVGTVDEGTTSGVRMRKQSAIMRFSDEPDPKVTALLQRYFRTNASILDDSHRESISSVLNAVSTPVEGSG